MSKINILFEGWFDIPHSYAIIMTFKIVHLYKKYFDRMNFYKKSMPYYNPNWKPCDVLPKSYTDIISLIPEYTEKDGIHIDLIYSVLFPYSMSLPSSGTKKCVFYTSEFRTLGPTYFKDLNDKSFTNLWFTGPSKWSLCGLESEVKPERNVLISHGVDPNIFYKSVNDRKLFRTKHDIPDDSIVFLNIGSMTGNKNISSVIVAFLHLVLIEIKNFKPVKYRLVLKGSDDLYNSSAIINEIIKGIQSPSINIKLLIEKYIIFIYDMLTYDELRTVYNGSDVYVGPYLAEGFSLTHLEALFCSLKIVVPSTGATEDYITDIETNDPSTSKLIYKVKSIVTKNNESGQYLNLMDFNDIMNSMKLAADSDLVEHNRDYLMSKYSWSVIADHLYNYFMKIQNFIFQPI
jgi:glycosyltransferase involved in cell wall biosynthesis